MEVGKIWEREIGVAPEDIGDDSNSNEDKSEAIEFPGETNENIENDNPSEGTEDSNNENTENQNSEVSATESEVSATESEVSSTNISTSKSEVSSSRTEVSSSKTQISSSKSEVSSSKKPVSSSKEEPISSSKEEPISSSKEEPAKPSGPQVVQGSTVETSFGVKIPVVSEFNKVALDPNNSWTGSGESTDFSKAFGKALKEYNDLTHYAIDSPIQDSGVDTLHNGMAFDDMGPVTLMRDTDKGCYYFYYTADLNDLGETNTKYNRDLSLFLLSLVTSTPKEVEKAIYESAFTAPNGKEPIPSDRTWTKIGDCEVRFTWSKSDPVILEYAIREAQ